MIKFELNSHQLCLPSKCKFNMVYIYLADTAHEQVNSSCELGWTVYFCIWSLITLETNPTLPAASQLLPISYTQKPYSLTFWYPFAYALPDK